MRRVLHLSDIHFGRTRLDLVDPLVDKIAELRPDLVVISGDLTQRARVAQFEEAKAFIDRIDPPVLTVPGNHDVPLDNLWVRLVRPFSRYRRIIDRNLAPSWSDEEINVIGVNTVNPYVWQSGKIGEKAVRRVCSAFDQTRHKRVRIVALHHPLDHAPGVEKKLMRGAAEAAGRLAECGADIVLCGHLHSWRADPHTAREGGASTILLQAGTGLSTRVRGEENDFNLLSIQPGEITVDRWAAGERPVFEHKSGHVFHKGAGGWSRAGE
ncbi:metallophosphoesterase [Mesobaculum littorinae]|uniref:Metallophosphoesterase n=1 Tax=Mesobaculum littorinae TaxID=2486419 RepID=A0A438AI62_9RHOB|nr:metallophosphoesterase [Mesobaculum littorinae]RVV98372.1 metallophosphoesterase [Mesobaculum littorinae]